MNPYPRRVVVISGYNAKAQAWFAMDDDNRDRVGYSRTEENAVAELYALIRDREADEQAEREDAAKQLIHDRWLDETQS